MRQYFILEIGSSKMVKIVIIDTAIGNIHSIYNAVTTIISQEKVKVVTVDEDIKEATHIILPGVGAFDQAMHNLTDSFIQKLTAEVLIKKTPFLGICIGMHLLADQGHENKITKGFGWITGEVKKIPKSQNVVPPQGAAR